MLAPWSRIAVAVVVGTMCLAFPLAVRADAAANSFCARLSTETTPDCVPVERGPQAAWDLGDIAHDKQLLVELTKQSDAARAFVETKNAESVLASLQAQLLVFNQIRAKQEERKRSP